MLVVADCASPVLRSRLHNQVVVGDCKVPASEAFRFPPFLPPHFTLFPRGVCTTRVNFQAFHNNTAL